MQGIIDNFEIYLQASSLLAFAAVYAAGVFVSFTPCVYPVIPLTVAYIGGNSRGSKLSGFLLSVVYVLGMAVTYTAIGAFAAYTGKLFGQIQSNPWLMIAVANVVILLGLSMLDLIALPIPGFLANLQPGGRATGYIGSFLVGLTSGLILGPCSAPVLVVLLGYVASKQSVVFGMSLLFVFALGMGTLLIILGTFAGLIANLPKAGLWMARVKQVFGWLLILLGEYLLITAGTLMT